MAAPKLTALETEPAEEFEDVALLLESDPEQQSSRRPPSWKEKFLNQFARGKARSHTGFEKLEQSDGVHEGSQRVQGIDRLHRLEVHSDVPCCLLTLPGFVLTMQAAADIHMFNQCSTYNHICCGLVQSLGDVAVLHFFGIMLVEASCFECFQ